MKLQECRDAEVNYSKRASDIARNLGFAGLAIVWIFKQDVAGRLVVPIGLVWATVLIVIALGIDFAQYVFGALYWGRFVRQKEAELVINPGQRDEFTNPLWYHKVVDTLFYTKLGFIAAAYVALLLYLGACRLFQ
jgi:hypothetical protein